MQKYKNKSHIGIRQLALYCFFIAISFLIAISFSKEAHAAWNMQPVQDVLANKNNNPLGVIFVWQQIIEKVDYIIIAVLIFIAFAQILRLNINTYGIKKILPVLIFAILAAHFSFIFCRFIIDIANIAMKLLLEMGKSGAIKEAKGTIEKFPDIFQGLENSMATPKTLAQILPSLFYTILVIAVAIMVYILAYLFLIRNWVIYFLVSIAPLAFMATVLPQTKSVFKQWWSNFFKWTFMPLVSIFWLWLGAVFATVINLDSPFMAFVFALVVFYLAITTPFKMGGAVMQQWGGLGKKIWGATGGNIVKGARERASSWGSEQWAKQGASKNSLNPFRAMIQAGKRNQEYIEHHKAKAKNYDEAATASVRLDNDKIRQMINERRSYGGNLEQAELKILEAFQDTEAGKKWMQGRENYLATNAMLQSQISAADKKAKEIFRASLPMEELGEHYDEQRNIINRDGKVIRTRAEIEERAAMFAETLAAQRRGQTAEVKAAELDKWMITQMNKKSGIFANERYRTITDEYFKAISRGKTLDEMVSRSESKELENIWGIQAEVHNMSELYKNNNKEIETLNQTMRQLDEEIPELRRQLLAADEVDLETMNRLQSSIDQKEEERRRAPEKIQQLTTDNQEIIRQAQIRINDPALRPHIAGMIDPQTGQPIGLEGLVPSEVEDPGQRRDLADLIKKRIGKLLGPEIESDAQKIIKENQSSEQVAEKLSAFGDKLINFLAGGANTFKNTAEENRDIEAHLLALNTFANRFGADGLLAREQLAMIQVPETIRRTTKDYNEDIFKIAGYSDPSNPKQQSRIKTLLQNIIAPEIGNLTQFAQTVLGEITNMDREARIAHLTRRATEINRQIDRATSEAAIKALKGDMVSRSRERTEGIGNLLLDNLRKQPRSGVSGPTTSFLSLGSSTTVAESVNTGVINAANATNRMAQQGMIAPNGEILSYTRALNQLVAGNTQVGQEQLRLLRENLGEARAQTTYLKNQEYRQAAVETLRAAGVKDQTEDIITGLSSTFQKAHEEAMEAQKNGESYQRTLVEHVSGYFKQTPALAQHQSFDFNTALNQPQISSPTETTTPPPQA